MVGEEWKDELVLPHGKINLVLQCEITAPVNTDVVGFVVHFIRGFTWRYIMLSHNLSSD